MSKETEKPAGNTDKGSGKARNYHNHTNKPASFKQGTTKFEGREEKLKGYIYDATDYKKADLYIRTTNEIADHVGRNYTNGADTREAILKMEIPVFALPPPLAEGANSSEKRKWEKKIDGIIKREDILESNMKMLFSLVWGQCSDSVRAKMEAQTNFTTISTTSDSLALLKLLKQDAYNFQSQKYKVQAKFKAKWRFFHLLQERNSDNKSFLDRFNNCVNVVEHCGGSMVDYEDIEKELTELSLTRQTATDEQMKTAKATAQDKLLGVAYLMCSDKHRFSKMVEDIDNACWPG